MRVASVVTGFPVVLAATLIGASAAATVAAPAQVATGMRLAALGAPLPLDPASDIPTADQVVHLMNGIADPHVAAADKSGLVEGGLGAIEQAVMDGRMRKGLENGKPPLTISAANIAPDGAGAATAEVTASSAKLTPHTVNLRFVNQDGWKLAHSSLTMLSNMSSN